MEIQSVSDLISQHGIPTTLIAVFIAFCWKVLPKILAKGMEDIGKSIQAQADATAQLREQMEEGSRRSAAEHARIIEAMDILVEKLLLREEPAPRRRRSRFLEGEDK